MSHQPFAVALGQQVIRLEARIVRMPFPLQRLPHEAGEQGRPAFRNMAFGVRLIHQHLEVDGGAIEIELRRALEMTP